MSKAKILIVDDEEDILELIGYNLSKAGYHVTSVTSGEEALQQVHTHTPDLIVLDLMLPGVDGLDVCRTLKRESRTSAIPIVMLTAKGDEADIVTGLELGADDYLTKPFSPKVLTARLRTVLRRKENTRVTPHTSLVRHDLSIDPTRHEVLLKGKGLALTPSEFRALQFLANRPGWVFTRGQIIHAAHGNDYPVSERSIDVMLVNLRKKLGSMGKYIETVRGVGYRFKE